jgi:hypothetical protein
MRRWEERCPTPAAQIPSLCNGEYRHRNRHQVVSTSRRIKPSLHRTQGEREPPASAQTYNDARRTFQQVRLNFLQVGSLSQNVEVTIAGDALIAKSSSSVGSVLPEYKVRDLPLSGRQVINLVGQTAGTVGSSFAGGRSSAVNTTRDGFVVSDGRYDHGAYSVNFVSPDLVEEVRIITARLTQAERGRDKADGIAINQSVPALLERP